MAGKTLNELFRDLILQNEDSGNEAVALRFSYAGTGLSGYSFGVSQLDVSNSGNAVACLKEIGFTPGEIQELQARLCPKSKYNSRLAAHPEIVRKWDAIQLSECLNKGLNFAVDFGIPVADTAAILAGADYVNQYGSEGRGAADYYRSLGRPITAEDVLTFKLTRTKYGKEHGDDCRRRFDNLIKLMEREGIAYAGIPTEH